MPNFSHVESVKAAWARYEAEHGEGFTERHRACLEADLKSAYACDATAKGNLQAAADLKVAGGDKQAALALALGRVEAGFASLARPRQEAGRRAAA